MTTAQPTSPSAQATATGLHYYLVINGIDGGSLNDDFAHSFEISDFSFDITAEFSGSAGGGSGSGKTTFGPLEIDLTSGSAADEITRLIATGRFTTGARLVGTTSGENPEVVYDLRLSDMRVGDYGQSNGGDHLSLSYSKVTLTTFDGLATEETAGWNIGASTPLTEPLAVPTASDEGAGASGNLLWYLTLDGIDGGSKVKDHVGAFEIGSYGFDISAILSTAGSGSGSGKTIFDPLALTLGLGSAADEILSLAALQKHLKSAQLVGVDMETGAAAYDLRLGDVFVREADLRMGADSLLLDFAKLSLTTTNPMGASETFSFDRKGLVGGTTPLDAPTAAKDKGFNSGDDATFYLTIDGMDGGSTAKGHKGAFEISGFDIGLINPALDLTSGSGVVQRTKYSPLSIDLEPGSDAAKLMQAISLSRNIKSVQIAADEVIGGKTVTSSFDLRLGQVALTSFLQDDGVDRLSLVYGRYTLTTTGSDLSKETTGYNLVTNQGLSTPVAAPKPTLHDAISPGKLDYYLVIGGMDGGSRLERHPGAFAIDGFDLDIAAKDGKVNFGSLELDLKLGSAAEALVVLATKSSGNRTIQLIGETNGEDPTTVYDLRLGRFSLDSMEETAIGRDHLSFSFGRYSLSTLDGAGKRNTFAFDVTNKTTLTDELAAPGRSATDGTGPGRLDYFMTMDGLDGGSLNERHAASFEIRDFDFSMDKVLRTGVLTVDLDLGTASDELLALIASGRHMKTLQIEGDQRGESGRAGVYDLRLGDVALTRLEHGEDGHDLLQLKFGRYTLSTRDEAGDLSTSGIDLVRSTAIDAPLKAPKAEADGGSAGAAQSYHLLIDGIDGGERGKEVAGAFAIDQFDFDIAAVTGGSGGVGKVDFKPISVSLHAGSAADELLAMMGGGRIIAAAQIVGERDGEVPFRSFDLRLADVHLTRLHQGSNDDMLVLTFDALSLTTSAQDEKGGTTSETYHFDIAKGAGDAIPLPEAVPLV